MEEYIKWEYEEKRTQENYPLTLEQLNILGEGRWELVHIRTVPNEHTIGNKLSYTFKREKIS